MPTQDGAGNNIESFYDGEGNSIGTIYQGDGTVVWSSAPDIPQAIVDDFEDNDLTEWSDTSNIQITSTTALEGTYSLEITGRLDSNRPYSLSGDGLDYYPQKGDKFSALLWQDSNDTLPGYCWGVDTNTNGLNGYSVIHHPNNNEIVIYRLDDGSLTQIFRPSVTLSTNQTYEYEIQWHDGSGSQSDNTIEVTIYETDETADLTSNLGRASEIYNDTVTDSTYPTNTGISLDNASSVSGDSRIDRYWYLGTVD